MAVLTVGFTVNANDEPVGNEKILKRSHPATLMGESEPGSKTEPAGRTDPAAAELVLANLTPAEVAERQRIVHVLEQCAGSQSAAARLLNIARSTHIKRLKRYGIPRPRADRDS